MRIMLDTTFLMPLFRLDPSNGFGITDFKSLLEMDTIQIFVHSVSIVELKWLIIRKGRNNEGLRDKLETAFSEALRFIETSNKISVIGIEMDILNDVTYELEKYGHNDYFDNLILAGAILHADLLLTEDGSFREMITMQRERNSIFNNSNLTIHNWISYKTEFLSH